MQLDAVLEAMLVSFLRLSDPVGNVLFLGYMDCSFQQNDVKSFISFFHICWIDSIYPVQDIKSLLSRLYLDLPKCQDKNLPVSLRMSLAFNILLFMKDKLKIGLPFVTIKLLFYDLDYKFG